MEVIDLSKRSSLLNRFVSEVRNVEVQGDRLRFRRNMERIGEVMAYEISKILPHGQISMTTPLGTATAEVPQCDVVLSTILRAGLPFHQGLLSYFDRAENAFVSAYRKHINEVDFDVHVEYLASPRIDNKVLILSDPMLATGRSMELSYRAMQTKGEPQQIHVVSIIASQPAVDYLLKTMPEDKTTIWCAAIDPEINTHSYIVPGLGDAGDLAYGEKE